MGGIAIRPTPQPRAFKADRRHLIEIDENFPRLRHDVQTFSRKGSA
jgi:hypothetical protein